MASVLTPKKEKGKAADMGRITKRVPRPSTMRFHTRLKTSRDNW